MSRVSAGRARCHRGYSIAYTRSHAPFPRTPHAGFPVVVETNRNVTFTNKTSSYSQGNLRLAGITELLSIPGNLSDCIQEVGLKGLPQVTKTLNLSEPLDMAGGLTVFAPTDQAFAAAQRVSG